MFNIYKMLDVYLLFLSLEHFLLHVRHISKFYVIYRYMMFVTFYFLIQLKIHCNLFNEMHGYMFYTLYNEKHLSIK